MRSFSGSKPRRLDLGRVLGTAARLVLNGPQRSQCRDPGLGQPLHPCNVEPFVGSVATQCAQQLSALEVPDVDGVVIPATGQQMPIGAYPKRLDCSVMSLAHRYALSSPHVPPAQYPIAPSTHQQVSALTPGDSKDHTGMPAQGL